MDPLGRAAFPALGTDAVVLVDVPGRLGVAVDEVRDEVDAIDRACSRFRDDSDLSRANAGAGRPVAVGALLLEAVEVALRAARLTQGLVDPTVGAAVQVLGYDRDFAEVARTGPPLARVARVPGWHHLAIDHVTGTLTVPRGAQLDLGATAKALAADRAAVRAAAAAGCGVLVSLGGDLSVAGPAPAAGWRVRVTDWQGSEPDAVGQTVLVRDGGLATSSTTVRRWQRGDRTLHHIVDPTTGGAAGEVWRTVSVAAADCVDANVAATAAIIRGSAAPAWLEATGLPARLVHVDGHVVHVNQWAPEAA
jgi:thiamine biosynthesis lipoprotein